MAQQNEDNLQFPRFIELTTVDSTNNYALDLLRDRNMTDRQSGKLHETTIFAHEQTSGRGQRGKAWASQPGENVQMSLIVAPSPLKLHQQFILSAMIAVIVRDFISEKTDREFFIKWPNDIYFQDRKAGGILIENIISGMDWKWAVAGIGLNINQTEFNPELPNPVSLKQITGKGFDCVELAKELSGKIFEAVSGLGFQVAGKPNVISTESASRRRMSGEISGGASAPLHFARHDDKKICRVLDEYNSHLYKRGQKVKLKKDSRVFEAVVKQVATNGQLVVEHAVEERFDFGEVSWVIV